MSPTPAPKPKPLSMPMAWNLVSAGYATDTAPMLAQYAETALGLSNLQPNDTIVDVACGPGTLAFLAAPQVAQIHGVDFAEDMIAILQSEIKKRGLHNIHAQQGDGQALPFEEQTFDKAFSMFGLMFFPDIHKGFKELHRVLKPGGVAVVSSWGPVSHSPAMTAMFGAIRAANPELPEPQTQVDSLENPDYFGRVFSAAGFEVEVQAVTHQFPVPHIEEFWASMVRGSAPIQLMKKGMAAQEWQEKEELALNYLRQEIQAPTTLGSEALIAVGTKM